MAIKMEEKASVNVLWQNLIALNSSLYKENEERGKQLEQMKKNLQEETKKVDVLRADAETYQNELKNKNKKVERLRMKLEMVRQLASDFFKDDSDNDEPMSVLVERDQKLQLNSISTTIINEQTNKRKIRSGTTSDGALMQQASVETNSNPIEQENGIERDENLLIPLNKHPSEYSPSITSNEFDENDENIHAKRLPTRVATITEARLFACPKCPKKFAKNSYLKKHMKTHWMVSQSFYRQVHDCPVCFESFAGYKALLEHKKINHSKICNVCNSKFSSSANVRRHKRNVHKMNI